nr:MAG TPA: Nucleotide modification associated domain 1 [Caudoviricetes sp.]DAR73136.1 MAG TPA: Nucleotide modification associated domain 1 [Caudoviricetes sp.]DAU43912.1 MAG TPA: Nucleotide modification associated domain 1 [Caudoviricetes sp.]
MTMNFREITDYMYQIYEKKNADYGDSFSKTFDEFGLTASAIRINDKTERFKKLIKQDAQVQDESIKDTLLDLANYAVLTLMEMSKK